MMKTPPIVLLALLSVVAAGCAARQAEMAAATAPTANLAGVWTGSAGTGGVFVPVTLTLTQSGTHRDSAPGSYHRVQVSGLDPARHVVAEIWPQQCGVGPIADAVQPCLARLSRRAARETEHRQRNENPTSDCHDPSSRQSISMSQHFSGLGQLVP